MTLDKSEFYTPSELLGVDGQKLIWWSIGRLKSGQVRLVLGGRHTHEDLFQEIALDLLKYERPRKYTIGTIISHVTRQVAHELATKHASRKDKCLVKFTSCFDSFPSTLTHPHEDNRPEWMDGIEHIHNDLRFLPSRHLTVIRSRYGFDDELTLAEIARRCGITRERTRQIEVIALRKLRERFESRAKQSESSNEYP